MILGINSPDVAVIFIPSSSGVNLSVSTLATETVRLLRKFPQC